MDLDAVLEQTQWDLFWVPEGTRVVDRPDVLYLASERDEGYLNVVLRFDRAPARLPALVREVSAAHRGVNSRWMLCGGNRCESVERVLADAGYARANEHHGYVVATGGFRPRAAAPGIRVKRVETLEALRAAISASARGFGRPAVMDDDTLRAELLALRAPEARAERFVAWDEHTGEPLASAGLSVHPDLGFGYLWAGATAPEARGRGAYGALVAARIARAAERGCAHVGLYARVESSGPIVARQGFTRCGPMTYWERAAR